MPAHSPALLVARRRRYASCTCSLYPHAHLHAHRGLICICRFESERKLKRDKRETALGKLVADNTEVPGTFWATETPFELTHCCCALAPTLSHTADAASSPHQQHAHHARHTPDVPTRPGSGALHPAHFVPLVSPRGRQSTPPLSQNADQHGYLWLRPHWPPCVPRRVRASR